MVYGYGLLTLIFSTHVPFFGLEGEGGKLRIIIKRRDPLTISYFDNFDNEPLNKYKQILKNKKIIDVFFYL
jgi:hypothetical protein